MLTWTNFDILKAEGGFDGYEKRETLGGLQPLRPGAPAGVPEEHPPEADEAVRRDRREVLPERRTEGPGELEAETEARIAELIKEIDSLHKPDTPADQALIIVLTDEGSCYLWNNHSPFSQGIDLPRNSSRSSRVMRHIPPARNP